MPSISSDDNPQPSEEVFGGDLFGNNYGADDFPGWEDDDEHDDELNDDENKYDDRHHDAYLAQRHQDIQANPVDDNFHH